MGSVNRHSQASSQGTSATRPDEGAKRLINQGEVYWITLGNLGEAESAIPHPYVVVQDNVFNHSRIHTVAVRTTDHFIQSQRGRGA